MNTRLFLSHARRDPAELANRLRADLEKLGYEVWQDNREIWAVGSGRNKSLMDIEPRK